MANEILDCELCGSTPAEASIQGQKVCARCHEQQYPNLSEEDKELTDPVTTCSRPNCLNPALKKTYGRTLCQSCADEETK